MESFQKISISLPREKITDHLFYSTSKNWSREHHTIGVNFTKDAFLRQLSCDTKNNKTWNQLDLGSQTIRLQKTLNQKNELLIKQSKWKNYYLKEQIYVLIQQILEYLHCISDQIHENSEFLCYAKKLEKVIGKVQVKKKAEKNWIDFLGIPSSQKFDTQIHQKTVQTEPARNQQSPKLSIVSELQNQISSFQQDNKNLLKNLNILTQQIEHKQKEILNWQQKYSKLKEKREMLKNEYASLQMKFEEFVRKKQSHKEDFQKTENFTRRKQQKSATHFHTYSLDRNHIVGKSHFALPSGQKGLKIQEESQNLFVLSDTPFVQGKHKEIPISTGFIETRKKLLLRENQIPQSNSRNSISINKSGQKTISLVDKKHSQKSQIWKKNKTQNQKINSVQADHGEIPTNSFIYQSEAVQTEVYRQLILSQAITIEHLLDQI